MTKVFRLHKGQDGTGWFSSAPVTKQQLNSIITEGKDTATSIPSPFARIDLVKSAFKWVAENGIKGTTAHHKLVSDALDVAQLFYTSQRFKDKIEIVSWNPKERLSELKGEGKSRHSKFAETLQLFWDQDSVPSNQKGNIVLYNFESVNRLYFILNKVNNQIIGGTSPATLFFASPDVRKVTKNLNIQIGQDKLFDDDYASLVERESSFIEYFFSLYKQPGFAVYFPEVYAYLDTIRLNHLSSTLNSKVSALTESNLNSYSPCPVLENANDHCEVLGIPLGTQSVITSQIEKESDFVIQSDFQISGLKPLILPYQKFGKKWTYTTNGIFWDENTKIPDRNTSNEQNSKLPLQNDSYWWLTIGNFLEDKIIELPYPIDTTKFKTCGSNKYLLPLTSTYLKFFDVSKIDKYLTIKERANGNLIEVELKIPVKGGEEIQFKKNYSAADKSIEKIEFHLAIFPFLTADDKNINYKIGLLDDRLEKIEDLFIRCSHKGQEFALDNPIVRNPGIGGETKSIYYRNPNRFDALKIGSKAVKGYLIPLFKNCSGTNKVSFAIDFGTTNTHLEYKIGTNDSVKFENDNLTPLWQSLMNRNVDFKEKTTFLDTETTFEQEIMPYIFSDENGNPHFPIRTAIVHNQQINFNEPIDIISQINNYFLLEKLPLRGGYLDLHTDLKWSNYADTLDEKKVESYIEFLITLVYYKILLLNGDPSVSSITWFYPVSMDEGELGVFFRLWKSVYKKVFKQEPDEDKIKGIPESIAPYLFYKSEVKGLSLSIDIGGGSSDLAVFNENDIKGKAKLISSFKFAGNAIFGDGYPSGEFKNNSDRNGFVNTFRQAAYDAIKGDKQKEGILNDILQNRKNSSDFSSYLFALEQDSSIDFKYSRFLEKDKKIKLTVLLFYGAIAYYSAKLLKKSNIAEIPRYILLSGTGSKSASIIDTSEKFKNLSEMFQFVFEKVYGEQSKNKMSIRLSKIPKEVTCKGALKANISENIIDVPTKFWIGGKQNDRWNSVFDKDSDMQKTPRYFDIQSEALPDIESSIHDFYSIIDNYFRTINLKAKFLIDDSAYEIFCSMRNDGIKDYITRGIYAFYKKEESHVEESLFFYPLIGILNELAYRLSEKEN